MFERWRNHRFRLGVGIYIYHSMPNKSETLVPFNFVSHRLLQGDVRIRVQQRSDSTGYTERESQRVYPWFSTRIGSHSATASLICFFAFSMSPVSTCRAEVAHFVTNGGRIPEGSVRQHRGMCKIGLVANDRRHRSLRWAADRGLLSLHCLSTIFA